MYASPLLRCAFAVLLASSVAPAQVIPNPSFEADSSPPFSGYGSITGWTSSSAGLNPAGGNPFADNGVTPDGTNVAFVQSSGSSDQRLATTITGLTPGVVYEVSFRANSRAASTAPNTSWSLDGGPFVPFTSGPAVGVGNPYYTIIGSFTATDTTAALAIRNQTANDSSVLVDDFRIVAKQVPGSAWTLNRWGNDASTSLAAGSTLWAYNFGSSASPVINGVTATGITGAEPAVPDGFAITGAGFVFPADTNQLTALTGSGSASLAADFIYGGTPTTITLQGLVEGESYRVSLFGMGFSASTGRAQTFTSGTDQRVMDEEAFGSNNGLRIDHCFVAEGAERVLTLAPVDLVSSFHLYGLALHANSSVSTLAASGVAGAEATLHGSANPLGQASTVWFEWGEAGGPFTQQTPPQDVGNGSTTQPFSAAITGLATGILYEGRAVLSNEFGILHGKPVAFRSGFTITVNNTDDDGPESLRQSIADAVVGDTIGFAAALSGETILLTSGALEVDRELTIDASGLPGGLIVDGNQAGRILEVAPEIEVTLSSLTLRNGVHAAAASPPTAAAIGGAIHNEGKLTLNQVTLSNNTALGSPLFETFPNTDLTSPPQNDSLGGAIYNAGVLTLNQVTLSNNSAIASNSSSLVPGLNSRFPTGNAKGGAIYNLGTLTISDSLIESNLVRGGEIPPGSASTSFGGGGAGGGIFNQGVLHITNSSLIHNTARNGGSPSNPTGIALAGEGGGIFNFGTATVDQCTLAGNLASGSGFGNPGSLGGTTPLRIGTGGGAIYNGNGGSLSVNQSTVATNRAETNNLEAIAAQGGTTVEELLEFFRTQGIEAAIGGGIANQDNDFGFGTVSLFNTIVADNSALTTEARTDLAVTPGRYTDAGGNLVGGYPGLGELGDYGGMLPTMLPLSDSPAIDAGLNSATAQFPLDQRGIPRLVGPHVDAGAVEYDLTTPPVPSIVGLEFSIVSTEPITGVNTVRLTATLATDGATATGRFEHGSTTAYGETVEVGSFGSYDEEHPFSIEIQLGTAVPYHWRFVLETSEGTLTSDDQIVFVAPSVPPGDLNGDGVVTATELATIVDAVDGGMSSLNTAGYFTAEQVQDLNVDTPVIQQVAPGRFRLTLGLQTSADFSTDPFADFSFATPGSTLQVTPEGKLAFEFPAAGDAAFFRIGAE